jgi:hypothetical protein
MADYRFLLPCTFAILDATVKTGSIKADDWLPIDRALRKHVVGVMAKRIRAIGARNGAPMTKAALEGYRQRDKNPHKIAARNEVSMAIQSGALSRGDCESCGAIDDIHAHHDDYSKPLDVTWLCRSCHRKLHAA